jgi:glycosyltransferase involved in cell wall biosynthesis
MASLQFDDAPARRHRISIRSVPTEQNREPRVSVIVPVRNGRAHLEQLVEALAAQSVPLSELELVVADDGSTDGSLEWLRDVEGSWVRVTDGPRLNSYAARNRAVHVSRAQVLAFCDADCVPVADWLERGLAALEVDDIVAGRVRFALPARRTVWTLLDMDTSKDQEREVRNGTAETANLFVRRELFARLGGFEEVIPEYGDFDFVERAVATGASLAFASDAVVWHPTRDRAKQFLRAQWIYSRGYGAREGRAGRVPPELRPKSLVPFVSQMRSRRWWGRSYGPDRRWLGENGVRPTSMETLKALLLMYLVVPYLRVAAQFCGWLGGRRLRTAGNPEVPAPSIRSDSPG